MAGQYKFLSTEGLSPQSIWQWARQLVDTLNKRDATVLNAVAPSGSVTAYLGAEAPLGWLICDGASYSKMAQRTLFLAIGYAYGGSGDNFNVPDMRDRVIMGAGGLLVGLGETAGAATITLGDNELPTHTHGVTDPTHTHVFNGDPHTHGVTDPGHIHSGGVGGTANGATGTDVGGTANTGSATTGLTVQNATATGTNAAAATGVTIQQTGQGQAFSVLNPVFGVNMIIKA